MITQSVNIVDLHTHSNFSDGSLSPTELVRHAGEVGLKALALTDHDCIDGIPSAINAARQLGIILIPGVELNSFQETEIHILGYFSEDNYENMKEFLSKAVAERIIRNRKIIDKLASLGIRVSFDEVSIEAGKEVFMRSHIASVLVKKGYVSDIGKAFSHYLAVGKKAYVKKEFPTADLCVSAIKHAGGIPVLAHPVQIKLKLRKLRKTVAALIESGLAGIEAYYSTNTVADTENYLGLARDFDLIATGGSDFHGDYKKHVLLGSGNGNLVIPDSVLDNVLSRL